MEEEALEHYNKFLADVLEPWTGIEGSEPGEAMQNVHSIAKRYSNGGYLSAGLVNKILIALDEEMREWVFQGWFTENDFGDYNYGADGIARARLNFAEAKADALIECMKYGGAYGRTEALEMIENYKPI